MKIIIADDDGDFREALKEALERTFSSQQIEIAEARDGAEAVRFVKEAKEKGEGEPFLVFMDGRMPGMDGIQAIREIRSLSPSTRIIFIGSFVDDQERALLEGANVCWPKPMGEWGSEWETRLRIFIEALCLPLWFPQEGSP